VNVFSAEIVDVVSFNVTFDCSAVFGIDVALILAPLIVGALLPKVIVCVPLAVIPPVNVP
jgi:hypothetical protein